MSNGVSHVGLMALLKKVNNNNTGSTSWIETEKIILHISNNSNKDYITTETIKFNSDQSTEIALIDLDKIKSPTVIIIIENNTSMPMDVDHVGSVICSLDIGQKCVFMRSGMGQYTQLW